MQYFEYILFFFRIILLILLFIIVHRENELFKKEKKKKKRKTWHIPPMCQVFLPELFIELSVVRLVS